MAEPPFPGAAVGRDDGGRIVMVHARPLGQGRDGDGRRRLRPFLELDSPRVQRVRQLDVLADGSTAVLTDAVPGPTLAQVVDRCGGLSPVGAERLLRDLAQGLRALHEVGGVHGDLGPGTVVVRDDGAVLLVVADRPPTGGPQAPSGRAARAPERAHGAPASAASDVWEAAACLAWALGRGRRATVHDLDPSVRAVLDAASDPSPHRRPGAGEIAGVAADSLARRTPGDRWGEVPADHWGVADLVDEAERDLVLRAPTLRTMGSRAATAGPGRRLVAVLAWVLVGAAMLLAGWPAGITDPYRTSADADVRVRAFAVRDAALLTHDRSLLAGVVAPGSPAWERDLATLRAMERAGIRLDGLHTRVAVGWPAGNVVSASSEVAVAQGPHGRTVDGARTVVPAQPSRCLEVTMIAGPRGPALWDWWPCVESPPGDER